jgi:hypothetical protein
MVFNTQDEGKRWADVDGDSYITEEKALEGHENMVEKYISLAKIIKGKDEE